MQFNITIASFKALPASLAIAASLALATQIGARSTLLVAVGVGLGATLWWSRFGFAGGYRRLIETGDRRGLAAQALLALATLLAIGPVLAFGDPLGLVGAWAPIGLAMVLGAALFGVGMQLGGGCGSGTLWVLGGGEPRMLATLAGFIGGAFWGSLDLPAWEAIGPLIPPIALSDLLGWPLAIGAEAAVLALVWRWSAGRWGIGADRRLAIAVLSLALGNLLILLISGRPWSVTWAFSLIGAKLAVAAGWPAGTSPVWGAPDLQQALAAPLLADPIAATDLGVLLGSAMASSFAGRWGGASPRTIGPWLAAMIGGVMMGYGARLSYGCNIGSLISGVASTSLHGWIWFGGALAGSWMGVKLRPWFGLA